MRARLWAIDLLCVQSREQESWSSEQRASFRARGVFGHCHTPLRLRTRATAYVSEQTHFPYFVDGSRLLTLWLILHQEAFLSKHSRVPVGHGRMRLDYLCSPSAARPQAVVCPLGPVMSCDQKKSGFIAKWVLAKTQRLHVLLCLWPDLNWSDLFWIFSCVRLFTGNKMGVSPKYLQL